MTREQAATRARILSLKYKKHLQVRRANDGEHHLVTSSDPVLLEHTSQIMIRNRTVSLSNYHRMREAELIETWISRTRSAVAVPCQMEHNWPPAFTHRPVIYWDDWEKKIRIRLQIWHPITQRWKIINERWYLIDLDYGRLLRDAEKKPLDSDMIITISAENRTEILDAAALIGDPSI